MISFWGCKKGEHISSRYVEAWNAIVFIALLEKEKSMLILKTACKGSEIPKLI